MKPATTGPEAMPIRIPIPPRNTCSRLGLGPIESFAATWVVMMAAMMLPSAVPVVLEFARTAERRRGWPVATGVLAVTYLGV
jgi:predicted metal-binding membrane protein